MPRGTPIVRTTAGQFIGLLLGGLLAAWDWRAVFWINVPMFQMHLFRIPGLRRG